MYIKSKLSGNVNFRDDVLLSIHVSTMAGAHIKQTVDNITKSAEDKRLYRGLELDNGMKVNRTPKQDTHTFTVMFFSKSCTNLPQPIGFRYFRVSKLTVAEYMCMGACSRGGTQYSQRPTEHMRHKFDITKIKLPNQNKNVVILSS